MKNNNVFKFQLKESTCIICSTNFKSGRDDEYKRICTQCISSGDFDIWAIEHGDKFHRESLEDYHTYKRKKSMEEHEVMMDIMFNDSYNNHFTNVLIAKECITSNPKNPYDQMYKLIEEWEGKFIKIPHFNMKTMDKLHDFSKNKIEQVEALIDNFNNKE